MLIILRVGEEETPAGSNEWGVDLKGRIESFGEKPKPSVPSRMRALVADAVEKSVTAWMQMKEECEMLYDEVRGIHEPTSLEKALDMLHSRLHNSNNLSDARAAASDASLAAQAFLDAAAQNGGVFGPWEILHDQAEHLVAVQGRANARQLLGEWLEQARNRTPFGTPLTKEEQWQSFAVFEWELAQSDDVPTVTIDPSCRLFPKRGMPEADGVPCWFQAMLTVCELEDCELEAAVRQLLAGQRGPD